MTGGSGIGWSSRRTVGGPRARAWRGVGVRRAQVRFVGLTEKGHGIEHSRFALPKNPWNLTLMESRSTPIPLFGLRGSRTEVWRMIRFHFTLADVSDRRWHFVCAALVVPLAAIFHHAVFYRPTCMLNAFGPAYTPAVVAQWLSRDPSPYLAVLAAVIAWRLGHYAPRVRPFAALFLVAFLPLSVWIWDLPFTGRTVCRHFHDGQVPLRSRHLYMLGFLLLALGIAIIRFRAGRRRTRAKHRSSRSMRNSTSRTA